MSAAQRADEFFFFFFTCIFGSMDATRRITTLSRSKVQLTSSHTHILFFFQKIRQLCACQSGLIKGLVRVYACHDQITLFKKVKLETLTRLLLVRLKENLHM